MLGVYFLSFSFIFFRSVVVYLKSGSRLTFWWTCPFSYSFHLRCRCVPKIGFSADISIDISIDIFIDILIDAFIDISIDMLIDISIDIWLTFRLTFWLLSWLIFLLTFWLTFLLTCWLTRRRKEGVDFFLKSNNLTPTGGKKQERKELWPWTALDRAIVHEEANIHPGSWMDCLKII